MSVLEKTVGQLVAEDFRVAHVFSKFGIDFCCGGKRTLESAINKANVDQKAVLNALVTTQQDGKNDDYLLQLSQSDLVDHIVSTHHQYIRETAPLLLTYSQKMVRAHGEKHREIKPFAGWVNALVSDLLSHIEKEENVLFPAIKALEKGEAITACFGDIRNPIRVMELEHQDAGTILENLESLTNHYQPPVYACTTWKVCYATLADFVDDLHKHIHIENNILFPKVIEQ
jgi:regulator of cell morphogenesis and NO signaling